MTHVASIVTVLDGALSVETDARPGFTPRGSVSGVIAVNGQPAAISYRVRLSRVTDGQHIAETWSTPGTGFYSFSDLELSERYVPVALDHTGTHSAASAGPLEPQP